MPADEELVKLARRYPAFRHHLTDPSRLFTEPAEDVVITPPTLTAAEDDRPLAEKFPALKYHDYEAQKEATAAAHAAQREWDEAHRRA